jgi:hypothetical protein
MILTLAFVLRVFFFAGFSGARLDLLGLRTDELVVAIVACPGFSLYGRSTLAMLQ